MILVISSPSGVGKTTLSHMLVDKFKGEVVFSVSATTRPPRPGEKDGKDYYFITKEQFNTWVDEGRFLEHVEVFGNQYGTLKDQVYNAVDAGKTIVLDVDHRGARSILGWCHNLGLRRAGVFLLPPSLTELRNRLARRIPNERCEEIDMRLSQAKEEIRQALDTIYRYVMINDDLDSCFGNLVSIFQAERKCPSVQPKGWLPDIIDKILDS